MIHFRRQITRLVFVIFFTTGVAPVSAVDKGRSKFTLAPTNESRHDKDLQAFLTELKRDLRRKNVRALEARLAENVKWSFGGDNGKAGFMQHWQLSNPEKSGVWQELARTIELGCNPAEGDGARPKSHICPYVYSRFPEALDASENDVVTGQNVNVREKPDLGSKPIAKISYEIIKTLSREDECKPSTGIGNCDRKCDWIQVQLYSSATQGFVCRNYVRSPMDYRVIFERIDGAWKITVFVAGPRAIRRVYRQNTVDTDLHLKRTGRF